VAFVPNLLSTDPLCFKRDANGDLQFPLELASGLEAVAILLRERIRLFRGEWFLSVLAGIPYLPSDDGTTVTETEAILAQPFDPVKVRAALLTEILSTPAVVDVPVLRMSFDGPTRVLSTTWVAKTQFGDTPIETLTQEI